MRAAFAVVLMGSLHSMKLFHDFRRGITLRCPFSGCLWSVVCRVVGANQFPLQLLNIPKILMFVFLDRTVDDPINERAAEVPQCP